MIYLFIYLLIWQINGYYICKTLTYKMSWMCITVICVCCSCSQSEKQDSNETSSTLPRVTAVVGYSNGFACSAGPGTVCLFEKREEEDQYKKTKEIKVNDIFSFKCSREWVRLILTGFSCLVLSDSSRTVQYWSQFCRAAGNQHSVHQSVRRDPGRQHRPRAALRHQPLASRAEQGAVCLPHSYFRRFIY